MKLTILNGILEEEMYVEKPLRYMRKEKEKKVLKFKKTLYGLKQEHQAWNDQIDTYFKIQFLEI